MKFYSLLSMLVAVSLMLSACNQSKSQTDNMNDNPLLSPSSLPFYAPDFDAIKTKHFRPAFEAGMEQELEEVEEIANNSEAPTFENTIVAMEKSGRLLSRTASVFYNLASAHTNDQIQHALIVHGAGAQLALDHGGPHRRKVLLGHDSSSLGTTVLAMQYT